MIAVGAILAIVNKTSDISSVFMNIGSPLIGGIALILATWKTNVINAFSGGLAIINVFGISKEKEKIAVKLPAVIAGQKGLVDEKELIIPNMRGIMSARTKPLQVVEPTHTEAKVEAVSFDSVPPRAAVKMVSPDNLDELVRLLHEEAKVI